MEATMTKEATAGKEPDDRGPLVIWHADCLDGFTSAWVVHKWCEGRPAEFFPGIYNKAPPDVTNRDVIMVDFSYKRDVLAEMALKCRSMLILDHHKTAQADLKEWIVAGPATPPMEGEVKAYFDMSRSGAGMCWDFFFNDPMPELVKHVQDRDLWHFNFDETRAVCANLYSQPFDFGVWTSFSEMLETPGSKLRIVAEGLSIMRNSEKERVQLIENGLRIMKIGGLLMPTLNAPWFHASEIGNSVANAPNNPIHCCAVYSDNKFGRRVFSLRSINTGPDVSAIAARYGGGGHRNAAGFSMPLGWEGEA